jgi:hypothetical protein
MKGAVCDEGGRAFKGAVHAFLHGPLFPALPCPGRGVVLPCLDARPVFARK